MHALATACGRFLRDVFYGIDSAHAIRLGRKPSPRPPHWND
jgi:hypothetical protein